ncbi:hypothetical protein KM043_009897 [Ampulex compressa]|nr:hypothetical protein KM043_009897 [Ampulex compressa]
MAREPPPRRNDAALLSKIASQEKLRAKPPPPSPPPFPAAPSPRTLGLLLQESIRWLQESGGFYVKILQKIMARYTFRRGKDGTSVRSLVRRASSLLLPTTGLSRVHRPNYHAPGVQPSNCTSNSIGPERREEIGRKSGSLSGYTYPIYYPHSSPLHLLRSTLPAIPGSHRPEAKTEPPAQALLLRVASFRGETGRKREERKRRVEIDVGREPR